MKFTDAWLRVAMIKAVFDAVIAPKKSVDEEIEKKVEEERMEEKKCQKWLTEQLVERQQLE